MKLKLPLLCGTACLICATALPAATLIEQGDGESTMIMYIEGTRMRADMPEQNAYSITDFGKKTMYMVNHDERKVLDMSSMTWREAGAGQAIEASSVDAELERIGAGPEIAGYDTEHYVVKANGRKCQDLYTSKDAFKDSGFDEIWETDNMQALQEANLVDGDACDVAEYVTMDPDELGWALKTVQANGDTTLTVRIEKSVEVPDHGFGFPADYEVVDFSQLFGQMMSGAAMDMPQGDYGEDMDEAYDDEEYDDEEYADEEYTEEDYEASVEELGEALDELAEDEELGEKVKGFLDRFKKKDKDG